MGTVPRRLANGATQMSVNTPETLEGFNTFEGKLPKPKLTTVDMAKVVVHPLNPRFNGTNNILGLNTQSASELAEQIERDKRILNRVVLNHNTATGELGAIKGGRRTEAAHILLGRSDISKELFDNLSKTEAEVYTDLTDEQILFLANDQDQKSFSFTEVLNLMLTLFKTGLTWKQVAARVWRQYGRLKGQAKIMNEIESKTDQKDREARIAKWLRGYVDEVVGEAFRIGDMCIKALLTEAAEKDRLINTKNNVDVKTWDHTKHPLSNPPEVYLTQNRLDVLRKAKESDVKDGSWNGYTGGTAFKEAWIKFKNEDAGLDADGNPVVTTVQLKSLSRAVLKDLNKTAVKSALGLKLIDLAAGDKDVKWADRDCEVAAFEAKQAMLVQFGEELRAKNPAVWDTMKACLLGTDVEGFKKLLEDLVK